MKHSKWKTWKDEWLKEQLLQWTSIFVGYTPVKLAMENPICRWNSYWKRLISIPMLVYRRVPDLGQTFCCIRFGSWMVCFPETGSEILPIHDATIVNYEGDVFMCCCCWRLLVIISGIKKVPIGITCFFWGDRLFFFRVRIWMSLRPFKAGDFTIFFIDVRMQLEYPNPRCNMYYFRLGYGKYMQIQNERHWLNHRHPKMKIS